jgi:hypothetical protein
VQGGKAPTLVFDGEAAGGAANCARHLPGVSAIKLAQLGYNILNFGIPGTNYEESSVIIFSDLSKGIE